jgi:hypothetical protein
LVGRWCHWRGPRCRIFNPIASTILKLLKFNLCVEYTIFSLSQQWFWIVYIVGLLWLHHIQYLADVTIVNQGM